MKTSHSTIQYAAKNAYQLCLMRGIHSATIAGHFCRVWPNLKHVEVFGVEDASGNFSIVRAPIRKAWLSL